MSHYITLPTGIRLYKNIKDVLFMLILLIDNENICTDTNFIDLKKYC